MAMVACGLAIVHPSLCLQSSFPHFCCSCVSPVAGGPGGMDKRTVRVFNTAGDSFETTLHVFIKDVDVGCVPA